MPVVPRLGPLRAMTDTQEVAEGPPRRRLVQSSGFAGDVVKLASGTVVAQVLVVAAAPVLTRLFSPADFGSAAIFTSLSTILATVACLCYEQTIVLPEDDGDAVSLVGVAVVASLMTSALCAAVCASLHQSIQDVLGWRGITGWPWLLALAVLLGGLSSALGQWHGRHRKFGYVSRARVGGSVTVTACQLGAGALGNATPAGLVHGSVAGSAATTLILGIQLGGDGRRRLLRGQRLAPMVAGAARYRKFPLLSTWSILLNSVSWQLPALLLGYFFDSAVVGFYALGFRMLQMPMGLLGSAIGQVFFQRAARAKHEGTLARVVRGVHDSLIQFGLLPIAVLGVTGPEVFSSILGPQWHEAGVYAQILSAWTLVWFVTSPLTSLFSVLEMQGLGLWMQMLNFATRFASLAVGGWLGSARLAVTLFAATGVPVYASLALLTMSKAGVDCRAALSWSSRRLLSVVPACAVLLLLKLANAGAWFVVGIAAAIVLANWSALYLRYRAGKITLPPTSAN